MNFRKCKSTLVSILCGSFVTLGSASQALADNCGADHPLSEKSLQALREQIPLPTVALRGPNEPANPTLDVLVVYTPNALNQIVANPAYASSIEDFSRSAMAQLNSHLSGSYVTYSGTNTSVQARLVHVHALTQNESANDVTDINALALGNDGVWDEVQQLRDLYGADLVHLFVANSSPQVCGSAITLRPGTEGFGFSLSKVSCALSQYTFSHELAHTAGAGHDNNAGYYSFSRGYAFTTNGLASGTIMTRYSIGPNRLPYFSSPLLTLNGISPQFLGTATNDNRLTLMSLGNFVSGYRPYRCRADFNSDGQVSVQDIYDFLTAWSARTLASNFNGSGGVTVQDIYDYLDAFANNRCTF